MSKTLNLPKAIFAVAVAVGITVPVVQAKDRALLVGVGKYEMSPKAGLPGVHLDLKMMKMVSRTLGFSDIRVLADEDATLAKVEHAIEHWLGESRPEDRALVYFSTHGERIPDLNGDETDQLDEVLALYKTRRSTDDHGNASLSGVLVDDRFSELLARLPNREVFVLVDACHSGSATRGKGRTSREHLSLVEFEDYNGRPKTFNFNDRAHMGQLPKSTNYQQALVNYKNGSRSRGFGFESQPGQERYVLLAAAADNEKSQAGDHGSLFTLALYDAVHKAAGREESISIASLKESTREFIERNIAVRQPVFHPQLSGDPRLAHRILPILPASHGRGPIWNELVGLSRAAGDEVKMVGNRSHYRVGDSIRLDLDLPESGYLNLVRVDTTDTATVIFPNAMNVNNWVAAGAFSFPGPEMVAGRPLGDSLLVAILTQNPLNLHRAGRIQWNQHTHEENAVRELTPLGLDRLNQAIRGGDGLAVSIQRTVCATNRDC